MRLLPFPFLGRGLAPAAALPRIISTEPQASGEIRPLVAPSPGTPFSVSLFCHCVLQYVGELFFILPRSVFGVIARSVATKRSAPVISVIASRLRLLQPVSPVIAMGSVRWRDNLLLKMNPMPATSILFARPPTPILPVGLFNIYCKAFASIFQFSLDKSMRPSYNTKAVRKRGRNLGV